MSLAACAELVRRADPDRFRAAMAAPVAARRVLLPVYAFNVEVTRAPWVTAEPMIAAMRLQWWRDALAEIAQGGPVRRHEVATPLAEAVGAPGARRLDALVAMRERDIAGPLFDDLDDLFAYVGATAEPLMLAAAEALAGAADIDLDQLAAVARAGGLARFLAALPALVAARRARMLTESEIVAACDRALEDWPVRLPPLPARAAAFEAWEARAVLRLAWRAPGRVAAGRLKRSEFRRRLGLIRFSALAR